MGNEIVRPDWGPGGDRAMVSGSLPGETTGGNGVAVYEQTASDLPAAGEDAHLSERARDVGDALLAHFDCPDPIGMEHELRKLPQADLDILGAVLAKLNPGEDHYDAMVAYERKATIPGILRARAWFQQLPEHLQ